MSPQEKKLAELCLMMMKMEDPGELEIASRRFRLEHLQRIVKGAAKDRVRLQALKQANIEMMAYREVVRDVQAALGNKIVDNQIETEMKDADVITQKAEEIKKLENQYGPVGGLNPDTLNAREILKNELDGDNAGEGYERGDEEGDGVDFRDEQGS